MYGRGIKNQKNPFSHLDSENDPKKLLKRDPIDFPNRFKTRPKRDLNSVQKHDEKLNPKMSNFYSKMGEFFVAFLALEIDLQMHLEPSRAPKLKTYKMLFKAHQKRLHVAPDIVLST